jgi:sugar lactone lactonase YvrE
MSKHILIPLLALTVTLTSCSSQPAKEAAPPEATAPPKPPAAEVWSVILGMMDAPESTYVDPLTGDVYVSLIGGAPDQKDGNGRIAKISADGKTTNATWADGLNAPKGLRAHEGTLWTADIDEIVSFDMASGKQTSKTKVPGAMFLNDVATGADGTVYVTDMMANKIIALKSGKVSTIAAGEELEYPNGLLVDGNTLIVGGWGKPEADFTTKVPGRLYKYDLTSKAKTLITPNPTANIDGLESDGKGGYVLSDYLAGKILHVSADGAVKTVTTFMQGTADIAFVAAQNRLIVPHMNENKIAAYDISGGLQ